MARTTWGRTRASDEGVWVHNGFTSSHVPWDEVQRITHPRYDDQVSLISKREGTQPHLLPGVRRTDVSELCKMAADAGYPEVARQDG